MVRFPLIGICGQSLIGIADATLAVFQSDCRLIDIAVWRLLGIAICLAAASIVLEFTVIPSSISAEAPSRCPFLFEHDVIHENRRHHVAKF